MKVKTGSKAGNGTEVSFVPDFDLFEVDSLEQLDTITLIEDRLISLQMAFPEIQFSFNKKKIMVNNFKKYTEMFSDIAIMEKTNNLSYFIAPSEDGFRTNSYVNGVNTRQGGTYVDHFMNTIIDSLTVKIKRRHKVEVLKTTIKSGITFVMFARNFVNPKFDSQTKRTTN